MTEPPKTGVYGFWPSDWGDLGGFGLLGDYVGGFWGTVVSAFVLYFVFRTWALNSQADRRNTIISIVSEMIKTHDFVSARPGFSASNFLSHFSGIYGLVSDANGEYVPWTPDDRVDIAYTYLFYGTSTEALASLEAYGLERIRVVHHAIRDLQRKHPRKYARISAGRQDHLSHYMRNLFGIYTILDSSSLPADVKRDISKIVRVKLSNYDQALLALNIMSHLGREWENRGYVDRYKLFSNVPKGFFGVDPDIDLKRRFPNVTFEWEKVTGPKRALPSFPLATYR